MAPVIRITDQTFRRLQRLGEPLVDTPSSVIDRVLDHYEKTAPAPDALVPAAQPDEVRTQHTAPAVPGGFELFLVPARSMNLTATIKNAVPLKLAEEVLTPDQFRSLSDAVAPAHEFHCWATNQQNKGVFQRMRPGDVVLLTETATGKFSYRATVATKLVSETLAARLWPDVPGLPWKYIYVLKAVVRINARKDAVVRELGYEPTFWVPGHIRVNAGRVHSVLTKYGSLDRFLEECR